MIGNMLEQSPDLKRLLQKIEFFAEVGHWHVDLKTQKIFWSPEVYRIHGVEEDRPTPKLAEAIGYYHKDDQTHVKACLERAEENKEGFNFTARLAIGPDMVKHVQSIGECEFDKSGKMTAIFGVIKDISLLSDRNHEIEASRLFLQNVIDAIPDMVFVKDKQLRIITANKAFFNLLNMNPAEIIGKTMFENFPEEQVALFKAKDLHALDVGFTLYEEVVRNAHGEDIILNTRKQSFEGQDGKKYLLCIATDITQQKKEDTILRKIYQISSDKGFSLDARLQEILRLGCDFYNMPYGMVSHVQDQTYTILHAYSQDDRLKKDTVLKLGDTFCKNVINVDTISAVPSIHEAQHFKILPKTNIQSYIGMPVFVAGERYGTLNFSSPHARDVEFNSNELSLIRMISQWVGHEMTQNQYMQRLRESEERFELAAKGSASIMWDWDIENDVFHWAGPAEKMFNVENASKLPLTSLEFFEHVHPEDRESVKNIIRSHLKSKKPLITEYLLLKKDGQEIWTFNRGQAVWDFTGKATRMCGSIIDITAKKKVEQELYRSNKELELYASVVSHDLQQPLRAVNGFLELLEMTSESKLDKRAKGYIRDALDATDHLGNIIDELLEYARFAAAPSEQNMFDATDVIDEVTDMLRAVFKESDLSLQTSPMPTIHYDRSQFERLMMNLMENAVKYCSDKVPEIKICAEEMEDHWLFSVEDNGIGIPEDKLEYVFEMFTRVKQKQDTPGTGLGLAICRKIVESHDGKIWIESKDGNGTTFFFTVPKT